MKTILVPTDFSSEADNALASAHSLAAIINAEILLLNVIGILISIRLKQSAKAITTPWSKSL